ncbi:hypothetical protein D3C80_1684390 [compost metagenome]
MVLPEDNSAVVFVLPVLPVLAAVLLPVFFLAVVVEGSVGFHALVALYSFSFVLAPTTPSAFIPNFHWNQVTAFLVLAPNWLSIFPL